MRIFVAYGYNPRDKWVEEFVFPLAAAFGCEVLHGKEVYGGPLSDEVMDVIRNSEAVIGFTTRRDPQGDDQYGTHEWVERELFFAQGHSPRIPWVEVREQGVILANKDLEEANAQRIEYREPERAECLVKIAQALKRLRELTSVTEIRLGPEPAVELIGAGMDAPAFSCSYETLRGIVKSPAKQLPIFPIKGGLFVRIPGLARGELIRLKIEAGGRVWRSEYESVDTVNIQVKE